MYSDPIQNLSIAVENGNYNETFVYVQQFFPFVFLFLFSLSLGRFDLFGLPLNSYPIWLGRMLKLAQVANSLNYHREEGHIQHKPTKKPHPFPFSEVIGKKKHLNREITK